MDSLSLNWFDDKSCNTATGKFSFKRNQIVEGQGAEIFWCALLGGECAEMPVIHDPFNFSAFDSGVDMDGDKVPDKLADCLQFFGFHCRRLRTV